VSVLRPEKDFIGIYVIEDRGGVIEDRGGKHNGWIDG